MNELRVITLIGYMFSFFLAPTTSSGLEGVHGVLKQWTGRKAKNLEEFIPLLQEILIGWNEKSHNFVPFVDIPPCPTTLIQSR